MSAQFVTTEVTRFDAATNVFVPETNFTAVEVCFDLRLNDKKFRQIFYSPVDLEDLTVGVLAQAGEISSADDVTRLDVDATNFAIDVATSTVDELSANDIDAANFAIDVATSTVDKLSANDVDAANFAIDVATSTVDELCDVQFSAKKILACADKLLGELSPTRAKTNGVHGGLLFDGEKILLVREDIGRHNVFDKIHGAALRQ